MTTIRDELRAEADRHARLSAMLPEPHQLLLADENDLTALLDDMVLIADEMCASSCRQLALLEQIVKTGRTRDRTRPNTAERQKVLVKAA